MFPSYNADEHKWFANWEKNFDTALKSIKKFKEDLSDKPSFTAATSEKYRLYIELLGAEIFELKEYYHTVEPVRNTLKLMDGEDSDR